MSALPHNTIARFLKCDRGAMLVEFCMALPVLLLFFAVIVEGGRIAWTYQSAAAGVRDAARMVARMAPDDLCTSGSGVAGYDALATQIVTNSLSGTSTVPNGATVVDVAPTLRCVPGSFRLNPTPIVDIRAEVQIDYLRGNIFGLFGDSLGPLNMELADQSRVFGN
jgi:Flp pilus assembly protein TadG